ncbi:hypothetical protein IAI33_09235 [Streptococcus pseudopneumoniae]|nr:hypothetical protein [Streptococcus pseudopneumoniae]
MLAGGCHTEWRKACLQELSQAYPTDFILLVMDHALGHPSSSLTIPNHIGFPFIPPYRPEMNPIEQMQKELGEGGFQNKVFQTLEAGIDTFQEIIQGLERSVVKSIVKRE